MKAGARRNWSNGPSGRACRFEPWWPTVLREDCTLGRELRTLGVPYVMVLKPSHAWWHPEDVAGTLQDVADEAGLGSAEQPGQWVYITRIFRDGSSQDWWALEIVAGP